MPGKGPRMVGLKLHQFLSEGFIEAERGSHLERKRKVTISPSKNVCADNFDSAQRRWHFVSGGGSYVSNSVAAAHSMFSTPHSSPPTPLPICLPLCLAHPTPAFSLSLSYPVGYFPSAAGVNPLTEQRSNLQIHPPFLQPSLFWKFVKKNGKWEAVFSACALHLCVSLSSEN